METIAATCTSQNLTWPDAVAIIVPMSVALIVVCFLFYFAYKARGR